MPPLIGLLIIKDFKMPTKFNMTRDINGYNGFGLVFTDTAYSCALAANTDTTLTVPTGSSIGGAAYPVSGIHAENTGTPESQLIAIFEYNPGAVVWVANNTTAAVPAGATFAATASELNPAARAVTAGDVLHFITPDSGDVVSVLFYWLSKLS